LPQRGVALAAVQVTLALTISVLSYVLVERPIRQGRLGSLTLTPRRLARLVPVSLATVAVAVLAAGIGSTSDPLLTSKAGTVTVAGVVERPRSLPSLDEGPTTTVPAIRSLALVGDSVAYLWTGALADEVQQRGMQFIGAAVVSCQVGHGQLYSPRGTPHGDGCDVSVVNAHRQVHELRPDLVLWHDVNASFARMSPSGELLLEGPEWQEQVFAEWDKALAELKGPSTTVVLILPPWRSVDPPGCAGAIRADRCHEVQGQDTRIRAATAEYLRRHAADPRVVGIDVDDLVCPAMPCAVEIDGIRIRGKLPDLTHFTGEGARWLAPHLIDRALAAARAAEIASLRIPEG
ncbi:MAG: SGNH hydrolase domain-containing protein, partial [Acidimicrobiales bacterium]|nr:SGNH hydrolase domain-containing protein [Acidimicrobiales bacterium]